MKNIPIELLEHKQSGITTLCFIEKIGPLPDGSYFGLTSGNRDLVFDDGRGGGSITYHAATGMQPSAMAAGADLSVDNSETQTLMPVYPLDVGITQAMVDNGDLDGVQWWIYQVNYEDLTQGAEVFGSGVIGEVRITPGGLVTFENRSWSQLLKQNSVVELDSLTCRARFGSQPVGTGGGAFEQRFPCRFNLDAEWVDFTVSALGAEVVRQFYSDDLVEDVDYYAPGLIEWTTGANAGQQHEVSGYLGPVVDPPAGGAVELQFTTRNPISIGDTGRIRRDCTKRWSGHNSCETYANRQWFRGEPFIPTSDVTGLTIPGAAAGGTGGAASTTVAE
ncbi:MAG: DUF2163 domain-containing protein [Lysobacter sp.]